MPKEIYYPAGFFEEELANKYARNFGVPKSFARFLVEQDEEIDAQYEEKNKKLYMTLISLKDIAVTRTNQDQLNVSFLNWLSSFNEDEQQAVEYMKKDGVSITLAHFIVEQVNKLYLEREINKKEKREYLVKVWIEREQSIFMN